MEDLIVRVGSDRYSFQIVIVHAPGQTGHPFHPYLATAQGTWVEGTGKTREAARTQLRAQLESNIRAQGRDWAITNGGLPA